MHSMKIYTLIAGVNGVGKSSLSGVLRAERNDLGYIIDVDKIAVEGCLSAIDAGKAALEKINSFLAKEVSFTQETTLSGMRSEKTVKMAKDRGYKIRLFYVGLNSSEESIERIRNRVRKGGHDIPNDDVMRRFNGRFDSLTKILPYCNEVYLYDNENGFVEVGEFKNGEILYKGDYRPNWLIELDSKVEGI